MIETSSKKLKDRIGGVEYLTFASSTAPTRIETAALSSSSIVEGTYTFLIKASISTNSSISASYVINLNVVEACSIANLVNPGQPAIQPTYTYTVSASYEFTFKTD